MSSPRRHRRRHRPLTLIDPLGARIPRIPRAHWSQGRLAPPGWALLAVAAFWLLVAVLILRYV